jgi:hypothetical protein
MTTCNRSLSDRAFVISQDGCVPSVLVAALSSMTSTRLPWRSDRHDSDSRIVLGLQEGNHNLQCLRAPATIHIRQSNANLEWPQNRYKMMKANFYSLSRPSLFLPAPRDRQSNELNRTLARSCSTLRKEATLCTIHFNSDGSNFGVAVGAAVVFIMSVDGPLVGSCLVPTFRSQSESRTRAIAFLPTRTGSRYPVRLILSR